MKITFCLEEDDSDNFLLGYVEEVAGVLVVRIPEHGSRDGDDTVLGLQLIGGKPVVHVWASDQEEATHRIELAQQGLAPDDDCPHTWHGGEAEEEEVASDQGYGTSGCCALCAARAKFRSEGRCYDCEELHPGTVCYECEQRKAEEEEGL